MICIINMQKLVEKVTQFVSFWVEKFMENKEFTVLVTSAHLSILFLHLLQTFLPYFCLSPKQFTKWYNGLVLKLYSSKESLMSTDAVLQQALHLDSFAPGCAECNFILLSIKHLHSGNGA